MFTQKKLLAGVIALITLVWIGQVFGYEELGFYIQKSLAAESPSNEVFTGMTTMLAVIVTAVNFLTFLIFPLIEVILDPTFFLDIHSANEAVILQIWRVSRDIVNVVFAFMLVIGACLTVITAKKDIISRFAIKFVLGIILVNFTWFFPRVILDVGHVLAATIYQLPRMVSSTCRYYDINGNIQTPCKFPTDYAYFDEARTINAGLPTGAWECPLETFCYEVGALDPNTNTAGGVLSGLIFNHAKLPDLAKVQNFNGGGTPATNPLDQISFFLMFILNTIFLIALSVALFLAMLAMLVAFIIRIPVLWMTMAFMPFMFIGFVLEDKMGNFNTMKIFDHFVKAAFLPAITAIPFAIGYIVLNALAFSAPTGTAIKLEFADGRFLPGVDNLWIVLWQITTILVIWKGFFMALSIDSIYADATKGIKSVGSNLGGIAASLPLNIPFLPGAKDPDTGKTDFISLGEANTRMRGVGALAKQGKLLDRKALSGLLGGDSKTGVSTAATDIRNADNITEIRGAANSNDIAKLTAELKKLDSDLGHLSAADQVKALEQVLGNPLSKRVRDGVISGLGGSSGGGTVRTGATPPSGGGGSGGSGSGP